METHKQHYGSGIMIFDICTSKSGQPYNSIIIKLPVKCIIVRIAFVMRDDGTCGLAMCDTIVLGILAMITIVYCQEFI